MVKIRVNQYTGPKGSNPGGKACVSASGKSIDAYVKYCESSMLPHGHPFVPHHQPIYEAATFYLCNALGLHIPEYYILDGINDSIAISIQPPTKRKEKLKDDRKYYIISALVKEFSLDSHVDSFLKRDIFHRDLLMVGDMEHRKNNFYLLDDHQGKRIMYVDLGYSFVDAHENKISQRNWTASLLSTHSVSNSRQNKKRIRKAMQYLARYALTTCDGKDIIEPKTFIDELPKIKIPIFPHKTMDLEHLLSEHEIDEMQGMLYINFWLTLKKALKEGRTEHIVAIK